MELITLAVLDDRHADRPVTLVEWAGVPAVAKRYANVLLADTCHVRLIDFDRFQAAGAGRDVAYWGAWIWAAILLQGRSPVGNRPTISQRATYFIAPRLDQNSG